jgi:DNA-binding MarR family transcriptional regulator
MSYHEEIVRQIDLINEYLTKELFHPNKGFGELTLVQLRTIIFIKNKKTASLREIARDLNITKPAAQSLVNKLLKTQWLQQVNSNHKDIQFQLSATAGVRFKKFLVRERQVYAKNMTYLTIREKEGLIRILHKIISHINLS